MGTLPGACQALTFRPTWWLGQYKRGEHERGSQGPVGRARGGHGGCWSPDRKPRRGGGEPQNRPRSGLRGPESGPGRGVFAGRRAGGKGARPRRGGPEGRGPEGGDILAQATAFGRAAPPEQRAHQRARRGTPETRGTTSGRRGCGLDGFPRREHQGRVQARPRSRGDPLQERDRCPQERLRALGGATAR